MTRCAATKAAGGVMAFIASNMDNAPVYRCTLAAGHEGEHVGKYSPMPGFADEYARWSEPAGVVAVQQATADTEKSA